MVYDFGYRLRELRLSKQMTQAQVAKRLNLSKTTISGYENNIKTPSIDVLVRLANLYGVTSDYILGIEKKKVLVIDGLTENEERILKALINEFHQQIM
ncbi:MAG TPA: helix-turn-helix domain-containing protein [Firmicutes bacterium]|nr:helix-turn-helix domain-containing protein [Bacillota bacterium]